MVVLPYTAGLSEKLARIYKRHSISLVSKPANTLRNILVAPKDKLPKEKNLRLYLPPELL